MQVVKKALLYFLVILFSLAAFAPKRELYYLLEAYLMRQDIVIDNEEIKSGLFSLELEHPVFYVKGIRVADIEKVSLYSLLFYTAAMARGINTDASFRRWVPEKIETVSLHYQILNPMNIVLKAKGSFGTLKGYISIRQRVMHLDLTEEKSIGVLKPLLKKGEKGWYYETSF